MWRGKPDVGQGQFNRAGLARFCLCRVAQPLRDETVTKPSRNLLKTIFALILRLPPNLERAGMIGNVEIGGMEQLHLAHHLADRRARRCRDGLTAGRCETAVLTTPFQLALAIPFRFDKSAAVGGEREKRIVVETRA